MRKKLPQVPPGSPALPPESGGSSSSGGGAAVGGGVPLEVCMTSGLTHSFEMCGHDVMKRTSFNGLDYKVKS